MKPAMKFPLFSKTLVKAFSPVAMQRRTTRATKLLKAFNDAFRIPVPPQPPHRPKKRSPSATSAAKGINKPAVAGTFLALEHPGPGGSRRYKLYVPSAYSGAPMPLIVMLHGCKQGPDDFANGTRMNELAESYGLFVAYPEQTARANGARCWNWFEKAQQIRSGDEPTRIAGTVHHIAETYVVEERQVFVAGLSAGAAMALILGQTHPEVFAGVAAHSGLPVGAAHDVASAFSAMRGGSPTWDPLDHPVPTMVLHGDRDNTVALSNGAAITRQAAAAFSAAGIQLRKHATETSAGHRSSATSYTDTKGTVVLQEMVVAGGSHAWFGGSPAGSYTEPAGPDASAQIVHFFAGLLRT